MIKLTETQIDNIQIFIGQCDYLTVEEIPNKHNNRTIKEYKSFLKFIREIDSVIINLHNYSGSYSEKQSYTKLMSLCRKYYFDSNGWGLLEYKIRTILFNWAEKNNWEIK